MASINSVVSNTLRVAVKDVSQVIETTQESEGVPETLELPLTTEEITASAGTGENLEASLEADLEAEPEEITRDLQGFKIFFRINSLRTVETKLLQVL